MKLNKWTLGLAAVGAVSLASATRASEEKAKLMSEANRMKDNGLAAKIAAAVNGAPVEVRPLERSVNPMCNYYLARTKADGKLHHVVAINWMTEEVLLCDALTQAPPAYAAQLEDVEIVGRNDNPELPWGRIIPAGN